MEINFTGKKVLVTGAGQGIGRALSEALYAAGAEVVAVSRTREHLDSLAAGKDPARMRVAAVDLADWGAVEGMAAAAGGGLAGDLDGLVNNAGINILEKTEDITRENFDRILDVNLRAVVNLTRIVARGMRERGAGGSIVNVSSQASLVGLENHATYACAKGGMDSFTRVMAVEYGPHNIRTNAVNPTVTLTPLGKAYWKGDRVEPMLQKIPLGRFAEPEDIVNPILFLLSDKAAMINGVILPIDGGYTAQ